MQNQNIKIIRLVETGLLLALGIILDTFFKIDGFWAYGGSVTLFSMLPLVMIAYKYGVWWGSLSGVAHGLITMLISGFRAGGLAIMVQENDGWKKFIFVVLLDYFLAFAVIGVAGLASRWIKNAAGALSVGAIMGLTARYLVHFLSGCLLFGTYAEWFFGQSSWGQAILERCHGTLLTVVYSVVYNGLFMIPEIIITAIGGLIVGSLLKGQLNRHRPATAEKE